MTDGTCRILRTLGLGAKAGKLVFGTEAVCDALRNGKAAAVAVASGNSENTLKRLRDQCFFYRVEPVVLDATPTELGHAVGKKGTVAAVAVTDPSLAASFLSAAGRIQQ